MCLNAGKFYEVTNSIMFCSSLSNCNHACLGILGLSITQQLFFRYTDFFFREDCQWCNFVFINKYFPWKFKCFKNTSHKFLFICIQLWNKFGQIYIYYMKQFRKLTCCFLTIFFKTPVSSCFSKTSLIDTK